jgi:hypothetical protein
MMKQPGRWWSMSAGGSSRQRSSSSTAAGSGVLQDARFCIVAAICIGVLWWVGASL